ncbi:Hypothetical predicted protein [Scomber scombrus]|uniref:Uncharacterized protein n=1 Tax=Scomber scombrus TaxID=13677 RepID=A0AAV1NQW7_SCOSC
MKRDTTERKRHASEAAFCIDANASAKKQPIPCICLHPGFSSPAAVCPGPTLLFSHSPLPCLTFSIFLYFFLFFIFFCFFFVSSHLSLILFKKRCKKTWTRLSFDYFASPVMCQVAASPNSSKTPETDINAHRSLTGERETEEGGEREIRRGGDNEIPDPKWQRGRWTEEGLRHKKKKKKEQKKKKKKKEEEKVGDGSRYQDGNVTNSASDAAEVKGTQPKKVKDEIKAGALPCPEAPLKIYPSKARPPLTRGRQEAKYCTPLGDLSFSTDQ